MTNKKIDKSLYKAHLLNLGSKLECFIYANNFKDAKSRLELNKEKFGIDKITCLPFISAFCVSLDAGKLQAIAENNSIAYITSSSSVEALLNVSRKVLSVDALHKGGINGNGVNIAYIDTGIKRHLDFVVPKNRIVYFKDFISNQKEPYDDNGHGTFVAGVGSGNGMCSGGKFSGIAPSSNIISLKALGESGDSSAATILEAMQWVFDNHKNFNIKVVCMSFGSEPLESGDPIMKGAEKLWEKGIIVVAAAGNSGSELRTIKSPGISPKIITVGGFDDKRDENDKYDRKKFEIAEFSSRGPALGKIKPDLIAPSVGISSCSAGEGHYVRLNGTSVATPMIAGLCALFLQVYPFATPNFVKRKLLACCSPLTFNKFFEGSGIPNAKSFFNIR